MNHSPRSPFPLLSFSLSNFFKSQGQFRLQNFLESIVHWWQHKMMRSRSAWQDVVLWGYEVGRVCEQKLSRWSSRPNTLFLSLAPSCSFIIFFSLSLSNLSKSVDRFQNLSKSRGHYWRYSYLSCLSLPPTSFPLTFFPCFGDSGRRRE